jgi:hypothetical protein
MTTGGRPLCLYFWRRISHLPQRESMGRCRPREKVMAVCKCKYNERQGILVWEMMWNNGKHSWLDQTALTFVLQTVYSQLMYFFGLQY